MMFKKLAKKLYYEREKHSNAAINPIEVDFEGRKNQFLNKLSHSAVNMYEHQNDINKFSKLVLSDPENDSHNKIIDELFSKGIIDPLDDKQLTELSENARFLRDLDF